MDLSALLVVCSGTVVVGILALQARWGTLTGPSSIGDPTSPVATRPDLRPLPRPCWRGGGGRAGRPDRRGARPANSGARRDRDSSQAAGH